MEGPRKKNYKIRKKYGCFIIINNIRKKNHQNTHDNIITISKNIIKHSMYKNYNNNNNYYKNKFNNYNKFKIENNKNNINEINDNSSIKYIWTKSEKMNYIKNNSNNKIEINNNNTNKNINKQKNNCENNNNEINYSNNNNNFDNKFNKMNINKKNITKNNSKDNNNNKKFTDIIYNCNIINEYNCDKNTVHKSRNLNIQNNNNISTNNNNNNNNYKSIIQLYSYKLVYFLLFVILFNQNTIKIVNGDNMQHATTPLLSSYSVIKNISGRNNFEVVQINTHHQDFNNKTTKQFDSTIIKSSMLLSSSALSLSTTEEASGMILTEELTEIKISKNEITTKSPNLQHLFSSTKTSSPSSASSTTSSSSLAVIDSTTLNPTSQSIIATDISIATEYTTNNRVDDCYSCQILEQIKLDNIESIKRHILLRLKLKEIPKVSPAFRLSVPPEIIESFYKDYKVDENSDTGKSEGFDDENDIYDDFEFDNDDYISDEPNIKHEFYSIVNSLYVFPTKSTSRQNRKSDILNFSIQNNESSTVSQAFLYIFIRGKDWIQRNEPNIFQNRYNKIGNDSKNTINNNNRNNNNKHEKIDNNDNNNSSTNNNNNNKINNNSSITNIPKNTFENNKHDSNISFINGIPNNKYKTIIYNYNNTNENETNSNDNNYSENNNNFNTTINYNINSNKMYTDNNGYVNDSISKNLEKFKYINIIKYYNITKNNMTNNNNYDSDKNYNMFNNLNSSRNSINKTENSSSNTNYDNYNKNVNNYNSNNQNNVSQRENLSTNNTNIIIDNKERTNNDSNYGTGNIHNCNDRNNNNNDNNNSNNKVNNDNNNNYKNENIIYFNNSNIYNSNSKKKNFKHNNNNNNNYVIHNNMYIILTVNKVILRQNFTHTLQIAKRYCKIPNGDGQWFRINITELVQTWANDPSLNQGIVIKTLDTSLRSLVVIDDNANDKRNGVYIKIQTKNNRQRRSKRNTSLNCLETDKEERCCRYPLEINFQKFGWDWIIAPTTFSAYFCSGQCKLGYIQKFPHTHLMQLSTAPQPCCSPSKMSPIRLLYFNHDNILVMSTIPNMSIDQCNCS